MDEDDGPLATTAPRSPEVTPRTGIPSLSELWYGLKTAFWVVLIGGGACYAIYAGAVWVKDRYFETPADLAKKVNACWNEAEVNEARGTECAAMYLRLKALKKREQAEKFCTDQGLKFKGTIGDQVECEP